MAVNMEEDFNIAFPIKFNPLKHHWDCILHLLQSANQTDIIEQFSEFCNNYIDIYTGQLSPEQISNEILSELIFNERLLLPHFKIWISLGRGYRTIRLTDHSEWIIRESDDERRYIHVHPARTGPLSFRMKGSTLKTLLLLKLEFPDIRSVDQLNKIRRKIGLSPIKKLELGKGILRYYEKLFGPFDIQE
jgi:hypothetical protein